MDCWFLISDLDIGYWIFYLVTDYEFWILDFPYRTLLIMNIGFLNFDFGFGYRIWILNIECCKSNFVYRTLDKQCWIWHFGYPVSDVVYWISEFGYRIMNILLLIFYFGFKYQVLNLSIGIGSLVLDTEFLKSNLDIEYGVLDFVFQTLAMRWWISNFWYRNLNAGFWRIDLVYGRLDIEFWF